MRSAPHLDLHRKWFPLAKMIQSPAIKLTTLRQVLAVKLFQNNHLPQGDTNRKVLKTVQQARISHKQLLLR